MSDLLFKCPNCSKSLSVSEKSVGKTFNCPQCQTKVTTPETAVEFICPSCKADLCAPDGLQNEQFDCPSCGNKVMVPAAEDSQGEAKEWFYGLDGQEIGPVGEDILISMFQKGTLTPDTKVWTEELEDWVPASSIEGLLPKELRFRPVSQQPLPALKAQADDSRPPTPVQWGAKSSTVSPTARQQSGLMSFLFKAAVILALVGTVIGVRKHLHNGKVADAYKRAIEVAQTAKTPDEAIQALDKVIAEYPDADAANSARELRNRADRRRGQDVALNAALAGRSGKVDREHYDEAISILETAIRDNAEASRLEEARKLESSIRLLRAADHTSNIAKAVDDSREMKILDVVVFLQAKIEANPFADGALIDQVRVSIVAAQETIASAQVLVLNGIFQVEGKESEAYFSANILRRGILASQGDEIGTGKWRLEQIDPEQHAVLVEDQETAAKQWIKEQSTEAAAEFCLLDPATGAMHGPFSFLDGGRLGATYEISMSTNKNEFTVASVSTGKKCGKYKYEHGEEVKLNATTYLLLNKNISNEVAWIEAEKRAKAEYERGQREKGLVKFEGKWMTQQELAAIKEARKQIAEKANSKQACTRCGGSKSVNEQVKVVCSSCGGRGSRSGLASWRGVGTKGRGSSTPIQCITCKGSGRVPKTKSVACPACQSAEYAEWAPSGGWGQSYLVPAPQEGGKVFATSDAAWEYAERLSIEAEGSVGAAAEAAMQGGGGTVVLGSDSQNAYKPEWDPKVQGWRVVPFRRGGSDTGLWDVMRR